MEVQKIEKGQLLIADPSLITDSHFNRSVILLVEHNHEGSVGFILNKLSEFKLSDLVEEVKVSYRIYNGGPVDKNNLYFIHTLPNLIDNSIEICDGIYWGGDFEQLVYNLNSGLIPENQIRFFLGYSGWGNTQLENELSNKAWVQQKNKKKSQIMLSDVSTIWGNKMKELGGNYTIWFNAPENPSLN